MTRLKEFISHVLGLIFLTSFFGTILSAIFFSTLVIGDRSFNVPATLFGFCFGSIATKAILSIKWNNLANLKALFWPLLMISFACFGVYLGFYLPLNSKLILTATQQELIINQPFTVNISHKHPHYLEIENHDSNQGTELRIKVVNDKGWVAEDIAHFGKKGVNTHSQHSKSIRDLILDFPDNGIYKVYFLSPNNFNSIESIKFFQKGR